MSVETSQHLPSLSDRQLATLFELAGIEIPPEIEDRVWAEAGDLKSCAARLQTFDFRDLAAMLGKG